MKKTLMFFLLLTFAALLPAQTITLTGQYLDKKDNPLENATVTYLANGNNPVSTDITDHNGHFSLQIEITAIDQYHRIFSAPPSPNPFGIFTSFVVTVESPGQVVIVSAAGKYINSMKLEKAGTYHLSWGGEDRIGRQVAAGTYVLVVHGDGYHSSTRLLYTPETGAAYALKGVYGGNDGSRGASRSQDIIRFTRDNTTLLELPLNTPTGDTTLGIVTGNPGPETLENLSATLFLLYPEASWPLNPYFYNDDQNQYSINGDAGFALMSDTTLQYIISGTGTFTTTVQATDPIDETLETGMEAVVQVQPTLLLPVFQVNEDSDEETLAADLNAYKNPLLEAELTYTLVSQSNPELVNLYISGSALMIDSLQNDGYGSSTIGIAVSDGTYSETYYTEVEVLPLADIYGTISNLFDTTMLLAAEITIDENGITHTTAADADGSYHIQLSNPVDTVTFYPVNITYAGYTPYHTWATVVPPDAGTARPSAGSRNEITENYTLIPDDFPWLLYNEAFRAATGISIPGNATFWYGLGPPDIYNFNVTDLCPSVDNVEMNFNNTAYNLVNILPTFNPIEALPENIHNISNSSTFTREPGQMLVYCNDGISGAGAVGFDKIGPTINRSDVMYRHWIGSTPGDNNNTVFNQEFGTAMGTTIEPPHDPSYESVFTDPADSNSYTDDDYNCSLIRRNRAKIHYLQGEDEEYTPDEYDWELRPDLIDYYYDWDNYENKKNVKRTFEYRVFGFDGKITEKGVYDYDKTPSRVMKMFPMMFTKGEIEKREEEEERTIQPKAKGIINRKTGEAEEF